MHFVCNISLQSLSKYTPTLSNSKHLNELISLSGTYYEKKKKTLFYSTCDSKVCKLLCYVFNIHGSFPYYTYLVSFDHKYLGNLLLTTSKKLHKVHTTYDRMKAFLFINNLYYPIWTKLLWGLKKLLRFPKVYKLIRINDKWYVK